MELNSHRGLSIECVTDEWKLVELRPEWKELWNRAPAATAFVAPEWSIPWWRAFGSDRLRTFTARTEGMLVGLLPAYLLDGRLQLLGIGASDHLDLLADSGMESEIAGAMLRSITREPCEWHEIELQELSSDSVLLQASEPPGWRGDLLRQGICPALSLPGCASELRACIPRRQYQNLAYCRKRAERSGAVKFARADGESFGEMFDALASLHTRQWNARGLPGIMADGSMRRFLREAAAELLHADLLRLYAMYHDGEIAATLLGFSAKHRFYYYISGIAPDFAKLGAGTVIVGHAIEEAAREGAKEFDFLRGQEPYKYQWGARDRPNWNRRLTIQTMKAAISSG